MARLIALHRILLAFVTGWLRELHSNMAAGIPRFIGFANVRKSGCITAEQYISGSIAYILSVS